MTGSCCSCGFRDTPFLSETCGPSFSLFMGLLEYLLSRQCDVADPCRRLGREGVDLADNAEFDFIVVGAGVAGPVVASRLSENPAWRVLLVEAGPEEPTATQLPGFSMSARYTGLDWNYTTVPQTDSCLSTGGICKWPRGRMVSGTGSMHGMMYTRGHPSIFDNWARLGNPGWSYQELLPYFIRSENNKNPSEMDEGYHGYNGPVTVQHFPYRPPLSEAIVQAGQELGYRRGDLNGRNQTGVNIAQAMVEDGLRASTPRMYLRAHSDRSNLHVTINSLVSKILINPNTNKTYGVELLTTSGETKTIYATKEVIVSAGAVGSPHLLLLSGLGPKDDLEELGIPVINDLPVGRNLYNHVSVGLSFHINDTFYESLTLESFNQFLKHRNGPLSSTGITQTTGFFKTKYATDDVPDLQVFFDGFNANCSRTGVREECTNGSIRYCGQRRIDARPTNILPRSVGFLKLNSTDPRDYPLIDPQYFSQSVDLDILVEGLKFVVQLSRTEALQRWGMEVVTDPVQGCEGQEFGSDDYWACLVRRETGPENHQGGSCYMGPAGVLDPQLRVHGVDNLRVADASVFPYVPNGNPISSIIVVAEKCADMILDDWNDVD